MNEKIMGVTVGTPLSTSKIKRDIQPVLKVNGQTPDENGNVEITVGGGGISTETDPTVPDWAKQPNPPAESDPTVPDWAKQPQKPKYTASEVGARPDTWIPTPADLGLKTESWKLTYEDGTVETKAVYVG